MRKLMVAEFLALDGVMEASEEWHLAPQQPISGAAAYQLYMSHTLPYLQASGGEVIFMGKGGSLLIGPADERWDAVMLVRQRSISGVTCGTSAARLRRVHDCL